MSQGSDNKSAESCVATQPTQLESKDEYKVGYRPTSVKAHQLGDEVLLTNYAGNNLYQVYIKEPTTVADIQQIIQSRGNSVVRALGSSHTWMPVFNDSDILVSLAHFKKIEVSDQFTLVTLGAGVLLRDAQAELAKYGLQLVGYPMSYDATVGGMIAHSVHGEYGQVFSTKVISIKAVDANGQDVHIDANSEDMPAFRASLGLLGIIYEVTMLVQSIHNTINSFEVVPLAQSQSYFANTNFNNQPGGDLGLSLYYVYDNQLAIWHAIVPKTDQIKAIQHHPGNYTTIPYSWLSVAVTTITTYLISLFFKINDIPSIAFFIRFLQLIELIGLQFLSFLSVRLPARVWAWLYSSLSFLAVGNRQSIVNYRNIQLTPLQFQVDRQQFLIYMESEWSVPRDQVTYILAQLRQAFLQVKSFSYLQQPIVLRNVNADDAYLSPATGRNSTYVSMIWVKTANLSAMIEYQKYFEAFQSVMLSVGARPHWAKLHTFSANTPNTVNKTYLQQIYPNYGKYVTALQKWDPNSVFTNDIRRQLFS